MYIYYVSRFRVRSSHALAQDCQLKPSLVTVEARQAALSTTLGGYHPRISLSFRLHCQTSLAQLQLQSMHWRHNLFLLLFVFEPIERGSG